jgi:4-hydroxy-tetrahydrodipicolinate reductase
MSEVFLTAFGFGKTREELAGTADSTYSMFRLLLDVTDLLCEELGLPHDGHSFTTEFEPAIREYNDKIQVREGTMAGIVIKASTVLGDKPVATLEMRFLLGHEYVSADFLAGRPKQGWIEVDVRGTPGSRMTHETYMEHDSIGTWSTGTRAINAIPFVCAAKPGLLSPLDLPLARMIKLHD